MKIGFVGLGKMGGNMVKRLLKGGHAIVAFAPSKESREEAERNGARTVGSLKEVVERLESPRVVWLMVPAGKVTGEVIGALIPLLEKGDILVDGGNSFYKDSIARAEHLRTKGISFLDVGTSGGIWGLREGYCLMIGGEKDAFKRIKPALKDLAPENGYAHVGPSGSGHFVKMVHNAVEYAMLEAYGEGFELMHAKKEFGLDLGKISELWNHGSVVRSWLLELSVNVFRQDPSLESVRGYVEDTGEGRWAVMEAIEESMPAPVITLSLLQRFRSRQETSFSAKMIAALRGQFGGHEIRKTGKKNDR
ncbi:MAG: decarboxylating 6-phosphogluconate dehydrogenase [Nitrospirae bacterium]|nr:decarboxylating 6-phosphogluconate dehydrogenase [Nitrospirota bacterium]MCL5421918.1 decarboxylating 6-phosphogluconate dehydrogenase [Nitrospirota bacterium]